VVDQLETILRHVADELAAWHARALKAEAELKAGPVRHDAEARGRTPELEQENKQLRQRVEAARARVGELLGRLTFLEDQAREQAGNGAGGGGGKA
jgi:FtsZ-binding cell division protein ZapB